MMKADRWEIIHSGKRVGYLTDPTASIMAPEVDYMRYRVLPLPGHEALLADPRNWTYQNLPKAPSICAFQFRHSRTGELSEDRAAFGTEEDVSDQLAQRTVVMMRLWVTKERDKEIDAAIIRAFTATHPFTSTHPVGDFAQKLRWLMRQIVEGWRERRFDRDHPVEPTHEGRPFSAWLEDNFLKGEEEAARARHAILAMGDAAVPFLYRFVRFNAPNMRQRTTAAEQREVWENSLGWDYNPGRYGERYHALFQSLTPIAGKLASELAPLLDLPKPCWDAAKVVILMRGEALPVLLEKTRHPNAATRHEVLSALQYCLEPPVEPALPAVLECLTDKEACVRRMSLSVLSKWLTDAKMAFSPEALGWFTKLLKDNDASVRHHALKCLGDMSCKLDVSNVLPETRKLRNDPDPNVYAYTRLLEGQVSFHKGQTVA